MPYSTAPSVYATPPQTSSRVPSGPSARIIGENVKTTDQPIVR